jgi:tetratricopeptide (TPR) repeat protein
MRRTFGFGAALLSAGAALAQGPAIDPARLAKDELARAAILEASEHYNHFRFAEALGRLDQALEAEPGNPIALFLKAEVHWNLWLQHQEQASYNDAFHTLMQQAIDSAESRLERNAHDTDAMLVLASAYARLGMFEGVEGKMFAAARRSIKAIGYLKDALEVRSDLYDAYFGLGLYDYLIAGHSAGARLAFKLLGGIFGNKQRGIERLRLAAERGTWSKASARFFLAVIFGKYERRQEERALEYLEPLYAEYPDNLSYAGLRASLLLQAGRAADAVQAFRDANALSERTGIGGPEARAKDHYGLGNALRLAGQAEPARAELRAALAVKVDLKRSWVPVFSHLAVGRLADQSGEREQALREYKIVRSLKNHGPAHELAKTYQKRPYKLGEEYHTVEPWY